MSVASVRGVVGNNCAGSTCLEEAYHGEQGLVGGGHVGLRIGAEGDAFVERGQVGDDLLVALAAAERTGGRPRRRRALSQSRIVKRNILK